MPAHIFQGAVAFTFDSFLFLHQSTADRVQAQPSQNMLDLWAKYMTVGWHCDIVTPFKLWLLPLFHTWQSAQEAEKQWRSPVPGLWMRSVASAPTGHSFNISTTRPWPAAATGCWFTSRIRSPSMRPAAACEPGSSTWPTAATRSLVCCSEVHWN